MSLAPDDLTSQLDRIAAHVEEARAAVALIEDGDATALAELDGIAERLATAVAELKSQTSPGGRL